METVVESVQQTAETVVREFSIPMALVDFIPVALFIAAAIIMLRDLYHLMSKGAFAILSAGSIMVSISGAFKALWKLLYAANICDFEVLNRMFFPTQSVGFMLIAIAFVALVFFRQDRKETTLHAVAVAPAVFSGTMIFVVFDVLGTLGLCAGLSRIAVKLKRSLAVVFFVLAFVLMLSMGYLSSRDSSSAAMNWIEQSVNALGQLFLLLGVLDLHKHGIKELKTVHD